MGHGGFIDATDALADAVPSIGKKLPANGDRQALQTVRSRTSKLFVVYGDKKQKKIDTLTYTVHINVAP